MLVEKIDIAIVYPFGNLLSNLVGATALNHIESSPAIFSLSA